MSVFIDYLTNLGLDAGKEFLTDKKREKEAKKRICDYIEMQANINELCTLAEEIDFKGIVEYLSTELLEDVKIYLFSEKDDRERMKNTILERACECSQSETITQRKRVEKIINDALKILRAFYRNQVDNKDLFLISAEIIDSLDESIKISTDKLEKKIDHVTKEIANIKKQSDNAKTVKEDSIGNKNFIGIAYQNQLFETSNTFIMDNYIKERYRENELSELEIQKYSNLFKLSVDIFDNNKAIKLEKNIFEFVREDILTKKKGNLIKIVGPDGTGKSTFLSLLYIYLYRYCINNGFSFYPFYINLHFYDNIVEDTTSNEEVVKAIMYKDLEILKSIVQTFPNLPYIIIIDGNENYFRTTLKTAKYFNDFINGIEGHKKIVCIGEKTNVHAYRERKKYTYMYSRMLYTFKFKSINSYEVERWKKFIETFVSLEGNGDLLIPINSYLEKFDLDEVDLNILSVFKDCYDSDVLNEVSSISDLYKNYCMAYLGDIDDFEDCAKMSYEYFMTSKKFEQEEIAKRVKEWNLIHQHKTISNFLIAYYYVNQMKAYNGKQDVAELEYLFPMDVNIFIKPLINENLETQKLIFDRCKKVYANGGILAKSQALYMMGRITDKSLKSKILKTLEVYYDELYPKLTKYDENKSRQEDRDAHLLLRSVIISLVYLGKKDKREAYLKMLLNYPIANQINRSFHLEYYGDVLRQPDSNVYYYNDDGSEDIDITYHILLNRVERYLASTKGTEDLNFQINLFTLCSLLQVRLKKENLSFERIQKLKEIINRTLDKKQNEVNVDFKAYLTMLKEDIEQETYLPGFLYKKLYGIKNIVRSGWKNEIKNNSVKPPYENVAEHIYYTWMLGMLYLPDEAPEECEYAFYNKRKILDLILIHDWAEVDVGDAVPSENSDAHREKEDFRMRVLFMHDTYDKVGNMAEYKKLWNVYGKNSTDINGKLAYELDKIQAIYQFYVYKNAGAEFSKEKIKDWEDEKRYITTSLGKSIMKIVLKE